MRFVPHTLKEKEEMLKTIGITSTDELFRDIPEEIRLKKGLNLPTGLDEITLQKEIETLAGNNAHLNDYISFLGAGAYDHYRPSIIDHLLLRSEFYTAYTPYQPEISQGTLQAIFEFQTLICELTGKPRDCPSPTTMSAPRFPGASSRPKEIGSTQAINKALCW